MYTVDDDITNQIEDDDDIIEKKSWNNGTGLIVKIIIIILCVIVLIWLIKELKSNSGNKDVGATHDANVLKVRLAAEEYFFLKNKKNTYSVVDVKELKSYGLVDDVVDANGKVCNATNSKATLTKDDSSYKMTINLDCSTIDKEETFYYHLSNLACQNCNDKTLMNGQTVVVDNTPTTEEKGEEVINNDNNDIPDDTIEQNEYSCVAWSDWQKDRVSDSTLIEKSKTLVQGVKRGNSNISITYTDWSDYTTTPITASDNVEVETKVETEESWSDTKTSYNIDTSNSNIRVIDTKTETSSSSCPDGYTLSNGKCYSQSESVSNLTYSEFNSGNYKVNNGLCEGVKNMKNSNGRYEITYLNCRYNKIISTGSYNVSSTTLYTYQELITNNVTYYRSRTKVAKETREDDIYTNEKYEENALPAGYVKVAGTEETFYSYKLTSCEK